MVAAIGYPLTKWSIRPFNDFDLTNRPEEAAIRKRWNRKLSSLRIFVEHAFGRLKGRFPYLRAIPNTNLDEIFHTIEALLVIHNILEMRNDDPYTIPGFDVGDEEDIGDVIGDAYDEMGADDMHRQGLLRRKVLVDYYVMHHND